MKPRSLELLDDAVTGFAGCSTHSDSPDHDGVPTGPTDAKGSIQLAWIGAVSPALPQANATSDSETSSVLTTSSGLVLTRSVVSEP